MVFSANNGGIVIDILTRSVHLLVILTHWADLDDECFDIFIDNGAPIHNRGITSEPGLYFVGLPYLSGKGSSFIWGVWHDAKRIAEYIDIQRHYQRYQSSEKV